MQTYTVGFVARVLWVAGMSVDGARVIALHLAAEGHHLTRGTADAPAHSVTEAALQTAGLTPVAAKAMAVALGQRGFKIAADPEVRVSSAAW